MNLAIKEKSQQKPETSFIKQNLLLKFNERAEGIEISLKYNKNQKSSVDTKYTLQAASQISEYFLDTKKV